MIFIILLHVHARMSVSQCHPAFIFGAQMFCEKWITHEVSIRYIYVIANYFFSPPSQQFGKVKNWCFCLIIDKKDVDTVYATWNNEWIEYFKGFPLVIQVTRILIFRSLWFTISVSVRVSQNMRLHCTAIKSIQCKQLTVFPLNQRFTV